MAYQMAAMAVTLNDVQGHSLVASLFKCNLSNICAAFYTMSTDSVLARFLCIIRACCVFRCEHENVVKLFGYSTNGPLRCIIYEFMSNASLEDRLACHVCLLITYSSVLFASYLSHFYELQIVCPSVIIFGLFVSLTSSFSVVFLQINVFVKI